MDSSNNHCKSDSDSEQLFRVSCPTNKNNSSTLFYEMYKSGKFVDVTLSCSSLQLKAHKIVLAACSPFFYQMFDKFSNSQHPIVVLKDTPASDLELILDFIYLGEIQVTQRRLLSLIKSAEGLKINGLYSNTTTATATTTTSSPSSSSSSTLSTTTTTTTATNNSTIKANTKFNTATKLLATTNSSESNHDDNLKLHNNDTSALFYNLQQNKHPNKVSQLKANTYSKNINMNNESRVGTQNGNSIQALQTDLRYNNNVAGSTTNENQMKSMDNVEDFNNDNDNDYEVDMVNREYYGDEDDDDDCNNLDDDDDLSNDMCNGDEYEDSQDNETILNHQIDANAMSYYQSNTLDKNNANDEDNIDGNVINLYNDDDDDEDVDENEEKNILEQPFLTVGDKFPTSESSNSSKLATSSIVGNFTKFSHKTHTCNICFKSFKEKANLKRHSQVHTSNRRKFNCPKCDKAFNWRANLIRHLNSPAHNNKQQKIAS